MFKKALAVGAAVLLVASAAGAFAIAPTRADLRIRPGEAVVVFSAPDNNSRNQDYFRKVDLEKGAFVGPPILIYIDTYGLEGVANASGNLINNDSRSRSFALAVQALAPGDYVWVESDRTYDRSVGTICFGRRSPVFSIESGRVNVVRMDSVLLGETRQELRFASGPQIPDETVLAEFERARANYPMIIGEAEINHPTAYIAWASARGVHFTRNCGEPKTFQRVDATQ